MDLRIERTRKNIINAFIELRSKKPLERITVKELSELAFINKATFYAHYKDIYDLSEQLETSIISEIISSISNPERLLSEPKSSFHQLAIAFLSKKELIDVLFSGNRASLFVTTIEKLLKEKIYQAYPMYQDDLEFNLRLTFIIQGSFHAFLQNYDSTGEEPLIANISSIVSQISYI